MSDAAPVGVVLLDGAGRIAAWSDGARRLTGYEADELAGEHWSRLLATGDQEPASIGAVSERERCDALLRRRDGACLKAGVSVVALGGTHDGFVLVLQPAIASDEMQARLARVAHDLRSPLGIVTGRIDLLLHRWDRLDDTERREYLRAAERGADRASRLVSELLDGEL